MATSSSRPQSKPYDLEITIISAKHLKNVNWRNGILKPYCIFCVDPDRRHATKSDDSGSTKPVWNEKFLLPLPSSPQDSLLTLEIFHSKPSETPKPLVGTLCVNLRDIFSSDGTVTQLKTFDLRRPSGRPHGKIRLKLAIRDRVMSNYQITPPLQPPLHSYYYSSAPPPPPPSVRDYRGYSSSSSIHEALQPPPPPPPAFPSPPPHHPYQYGGAGGYSDGYPSYYQGYYPQQAPPPPPRPVFERQASYGGPGPSAPLDYMSYDHKRGGSKAGWGTGLGVGAVAGAFGGLALDEGIKYEEDKISERVESSEGVAKDSYGNYRVDY